jgi:Gram-negative bacterial TonB protein C-terminal
MKSKVNLLLVAAALSVFPLQPGAMPRVSARAQAAAAPASWERYTYPGEEFSVELPDAPSVFHTTRSIGMFDQEKMRTFGLYSGGVVFIIASFDKPRPVETLDYFAGYIWGGHNILTPKGDVRLGGFAGKEYESSNGLRELSRVYRAKRHAYLVWASTMGEDNPNVRRFLDSFRLEENPSGQRIAEDPPVPPFKPPPPTPPDAQPSGGSPAPRPSPTPDTRPPDGPFTQKEVARKAVLVYKPEPGFTEEARQNNVTGVVRLRAVLSSAGRMTHIAVLKWLPHGLTEKAIAAAHHILFFPAEKDGHAVSQYVVLEYNFNIY